MFKGNNYTISWPVRILALLILPILLLASSFSSSRASKPLASAAPLASTATAQDKAPALSCNYCISPTDQSFTHEGGNGSIAVSAPAACSWTASTSDSFLTFTSATSGTGNGVLTFSVAANTGTTPRVASIAIAGRNFNVFQGVAFNDVPTTHPFYTEIGKLSARAITLGCG